MCWTQPVLSLRESCFWTDEAYGAETLHVAKDFGILVGSMGRPSVPSPYPHSAHFALPALCPELAFLLCPQTLATLIRPCSDNLRTSSMLCAVIVGPRRLPLCLVVAWPGQRGCLMLPVWWHVCQSSPVTCSLTCVFVFSSKQQT